MKENPTVELILPCRNEEAALPQVLASVPPSWSVLVVDNGSTDLTADIARQHGATVVAEAQPGYGAAVHAGLFSASADIVVVCDGDGSFDPLALESLVAEVSLGHADLVCGRRIVAESGAWPWHARWGNFVLARLISGGTKQSLHDIAPVRVARRQALLDLGIADRRFGYPLETLMRASARGWRIVERPVPYRRRRGGVSKVTGSVRGTLRASRDFLAVLWKFRFGLVSSITEQHPGQTATCAIPEMVNAAADQVVKGEDGRTEARTDSETGVLDGPITLLLMAKIPFAGRVKTRLTPELTYHQAAAVAAAAMLDTIDLLSAVASQTGAKIVVAVDGLDDLHGHDDGAIPARAALLAALASVTVIEQRGDGLDERLVNAHSDAAGAGACVQIGMDTPHASVDELVRVTDRIAQPSGPQAIIGPAEDGGWWLLAVRSGHLAVRLRGVPMSVEHTFVETAHAFSDVTVEYAQTAVDIDTVEDLRQVAALAPQARFASLLGLVTAA